MKKRLLLFIGIIIGILTVSCQPYSTETFELNLSKEKITMPSGGGIEEVDVAFFLGFYPSLNDDQVITIESGAPSSKLLSCELKSLWVNAMWDEKKNVEVFKTEKIIITVQENTLDTERVYELKVQGGRPAQTKIITITQAGNTL